MTYEGKIEGKFVDLISCTEDDAEFTIALRKDPELGKFFPAVDNTVEQQKNWIKGQRQKPGDYFFVVWNKKGERIGTIGLYGIEDGVGEGGRIIFRDANPYEVSEAQLLVDRFGFDVLGLKLITGSVFADNSRALKFSKKFSGRLFEPEKDSEGRLVVRVETNPEEFREIDERISKILYH